ncbi:hypothetical protein BHE74_00041189, partial [Ensete ventricosum]
EPAATEEEQPPPAVKEPATAGEGRSAVKQPAEAIGKKLAEEHPAGTEERGEEVTTLPTPEPPIAEAAVALSTPDLSQDRKAAVNLAPITVQPPPFLALEVVPCLGEKKPQPFHA